MRNAGNQPIRPLADRFWEKVEKTDTCWLWTGARVSEGYGMIHIRIDHGRQITEGAHRVSLQLAGIDIPSGFEPDHLCNNKSCVRPDHLEVVPARENNRRGRVKK